MSAAANSVYRARDALYSLDPGCDRDEWVNLAMAAKDAGLDLATFDAWSANADNYSERDTRDVWKSIKEGGGVGAGTLFRAAKLAGWSASDHSPVKMPSKASARSVEAAQPQRKGMSAKEVWDRCAPATEEHGYVTSKGGVPDGLRVVPEGDPLTIAGLGLGGALVVPVIPLVGGDPVSLQFIAPPEMAEKWKAAGQPSKFNLPGGKLDGVFTVGQTESGGTIHICEGVGQAWACWRATDAAAVVAFGAGRFRSVASELRMQYPEARLVLVPDVGKETEVEAIAVAVRGLVACMPEGWGKNSDVNDLGLRDGVEVVRDLLAGAVAPPQPEPRFKLLGSADIHQMPQMMWRVRGVLPEQGLACVYGPSGVGKSFLSLDMSAKIAEGGDWFGHRVTPCPVVYVCLEGAAGLRQRVQAWEKHHGRKLPTGLSLVTTQFKLTDRRDVDEMGATVLSAGRGAVTIIDTLNASAPGIDENSSKDMGHVIDAAKTLQACTEGLVVLVHHTGKEASKGLRGHSSLVAALDAAIEVCRDAKGKHWRVAKSKDGADGVVHPFTLEEVHLSADFEGEPVSSCVVGTSSSTAVIQTVKMPQGKNQQVVYCAVNVLLQAGVKGRPGAPPDKPCIELTAAIAAGAALLECRSDKRTSSARTAVEGLVQRGVLGQTDGWLWAA